MPPESVLTAEQARADRGEGEVVFFGDRVSARSLLIRLSDKQAALLEELRLGPANLRTSHTLTSLIGREMIMIRDDRRLEITNVGRFAAAKHRQHHGNT